MKIFSEDGGLIHLLDRLGKPVLSFMEYPEICSGVFIINRTPTGENLYTVLGVPVKNSECSKILLVLNFWVYYISTEGQLMIARLDAIGMNYRLKCQTAIEDFGLLTYKGCTVKINGEWRIYNYEFGTLLEDATKPKVTLVMSEIPNYLKKGFSLEYLRFLAESKGQPFEAVSYNAEDYYRQANKDFLSVVMQISELSDTYTSEQIGQILGLQSYIATVLANIAKVKEIKGVLESLEK